MFERVIPLATTSKVFSPNSSLQILQWSVNSNSWSSVSFKLSTLALQISVVLSNVYPFRVISQNPFSLFLNFDFLWFSEFFGDLMKPHFLFLVELRYISMFCNEFYALLCLTYFRYYHSLPPVSKLYGVSCLMTTAAYYLQLYHLESIALDYSLVIKKFQVI